MSSVVVGQARWSQSHAATSPRRSGSVKRGDYPRSLAGLVQAKADWQHASRLDQRRIEREIRRIEGALSRQLNWQHQSVVMMCHLDAIKDIKDARVGEFDDRGVLVGVKYTAADEPVPVRHDSLALLREARQRDLEARMLRRQQINQSYREVYRG